MTEGWSGFEDERSQEEAVATLPLTTIHPNLLPACAAAEDWEEDEDWDDDEEDEEDEDDDDDEDWEDEDLDEDWDEWEGDSDA